MIKYVLKQNKNEKSLAYNKWYAYASTDETVDLSQLAKHMEEHNTGFSEAMCLGMMTAMVKCIKEQLLAGKNVKIDNLAIFSVGIKNKVGADSEADFTAAGNISGLKLRARATGTLSSTNLNSSASMKKVSAATTTTTTQQSGSGTTQQSGSGSSSSGSQTSGSQTSGGGSTGEDTDGEGE